MASDSFDLAVVGAGIVGLAHALAAARLGKRVVVIDRDARANGASVRNFGFVTVTGQQRGECWRRARRSRDVWAEIAPLAGIGVEQRGLLMVARRPEARGGARGLPRDRDGRGLRAAGAGRGQGALPAARGGPARRRPVEPARPAGRESRAAIPALAAYLEEALGVTFLRRDASPRGRAAAASRPPAAPCTPRRCVVCPGDDFLTLFPERLAAYGLTRCKLHMLRTAAQPPGWRLPGAVMSDLGLVRYLGYAELPEAGALRRRLEAEQAEWLANGVHLIVVQCADGSLVVGDSHHYDADAGPVRARGVDRLITRRAGGRSSTCRARRSPSAGPAPMPPPPTG